MVRVGVSTCDRTPLTAWPAFTKDTPGYYMTLLIRQVCCFEDKEFSRDHAHEQNSKSVKGDGGKNSYFHHCVGLFKITVSKIHKHISNYVKVSSNVEEL